MFKRHEPVVFRWAGGTASIGYLGALRWRVRLAVAALEANNVIAAVRVVLDAVFEGVVSGQEVDSRAPFTIQLGKDRVTFSKGHKFVNGWRCSKRDVDFDLGDHGQLLPHIAQEVAQVAESSWAKGVRPKRPPPLAPRFALDVFASASDPNALCRDLERALSDRMTAHPSPGAAFLAAMNELKDAGHDLWSWDPGRQWGRDYMTRRPGAGLHVTRYDEDDDDEVEEPPPDALVCVEFKPPE